MTMNRRQFMAATAAGFGTQLGSPASRDALAQTATPPRRSSGQAASAPTRQLPPDSGLFPGFEARWVRTKGADIFLRHGGEGPPLLLLHGNPQTHACWHKIAGPLASRFHVVAADLRGYGDSVGPHRWRPGPRQLLVPHDGSGSGRRDGRARSRSLLPGRSRPGRAHRASVGARSSRSRAQGRAAGHPAHALRVGPHLARVGPQFLALVLHGAAGRDVRAHDRRDSGPRIRAAPSWPIRKARVLRRSGLRRIRPLLHAEDDSRLLRGLSRGRGHRSRA